MTAVLLPFDVAAWPMTIWFAAVAWLVSSEAPSPIITLLVLGPLWECNVPLPIITLEVAVCRLSAASAPIITLFSDSLTSSTDGLDFAQVNHASIVKFGINYSF